MSALDAARRLALRQPGGIAAVAVRLGRNYNTLAHELNANNQGHKFGLGDAELLTSMTGDAEIAHALATACGHVCIPVALPASSAHVEVAERIAAAGKEFGDVMRSVLDAIADGRVTDRELAEFDRQFLELVSASVALRATLAKMQPARPSHLKSAK